MDNYFALEWSSVLFWKLFETNAIYVGCSCISTIILAGPSVQNQFCFIPNTFILQPQKCLPPHFPSLLTPSFTELVVFLLFALDSLFPLEAKYGIKYFSLNAYPFSFPVITVTIASFHIWWHFRTFYLSFKPFQNITIFLSLF